MPEPSTGATVAERRLLWWRRILVNSVFVVAWFSFSALLLLYNKAIVSADYFAFPYPLFGTVVQMPIQFTLAALCRYLRPQLFRPPNNPSKRDYFTKVLPTATATGLDIGLGNLSLKLITVSLYTMVKSSALIFVLAFAFLFKLERYSHRLVFVIGLITIGVFLMTFQTTSYAWGGVALVLASSALAGFRWSMTQLLLRRSDVGLDNPAATIFWLSPLMGLTLAIVSLPVDNWPRMFSESPFFASWGAVAKTGAMLGLPGVLAFLMVMSEFYLLQRVGIVTTSIVGIFKEVATISLGAWVYGDVMTPLKATGMALTLCGIAMYSYHKYRKSVEGGVDAHGVPVREVAGEEGYALVPPKEDEEAFAIGHDDDEDDGEHGRARLSDEEPDAHLARHRRPSAEHHRRASDEAADDDSLLEGVRDGEEDARSVRTVNTVDTLGSTARRWRDR